MLSQIRQILEQIFNHATAQITHSTTGVVIGLTFACIVLYLTFEGYMAISGKSEAPIKDVLFKMGTLITIYVIATSSYWHGLINDAVIGLRDGLSSGQDPLTLFDHLLSQVQTISSHIQDGTHGGVLGINFATLFNNIACFVLIVIGSLFCCISVGLTLLINEYMLKFLLAIAPLFIFCLSFQIVRQMFNNWLQLIFVNILTFSFLTLIASSLVYAVQKAVEMSPHDGLMIFDFSSAFSVFLIGIFSFILKGLFESVAHQIAAVSAEGVGNALGTTVGAAAGAMLGQEALGAGRMISNVAGYGVGSVASGIGKGVQSAASRMSTRNPPLEATLRALQKSGSAFENYGESMKSTYRAPKSGGKK